MSLILRALLLVCLGARVALAQDVTLSSPDGGIELSGSLLGFDGEFYRIQSEYGPLTVSSDGVSCAGPGCPDLQAYVAELRFVGPVSISEVLLPQIIETFALTRNLGLVETVGGGARMFTLTRDDGRVAGRFFVESAPSDAAFLSLLNGDTDIALTLREPLALERRAAEAAQSGGQPLDARGRVIGLDALVPIAARSNPVDQISLEELRALVAGEITNWAALGGPDAAVVLHLPEAESGLAQYFDEEMGSDVLAPGILRHDQLSALSDAVSRDPFALGIATLSEVGNARALDLSGSCGFALAATPDALKSEDYPLTAPLFLYSGPERLPRLGREFLAFFETAQAERVIRRAGYVSQSITRTPLAEQGTRLANAILAAGDEVLLEDLQRLASRMTGAIRLSPTIRFSRRIERVRHRLAQRHFAAGAGHRAGGVRRAHVGFCRLFGWGGPGQRESVAVPVTCGIGPACGDRSRRCRGSEPHQPARGRLRGGPAHRLRRQRLGRRDQPPGRGLAGIARPAKGKAGQVPPYDSISCRA